MLARPLILMFLVSVLAAQPAFAGEKWRSYKVGGLTLFVGTKDQNRRLMRSALDSPKTIGFHPKGSRTYLATSDPGVILHEFAHTFHATWPGHHLAIPYVAWDAGEEEVRATLNLRVKGDKN